MAEENENKSREYYMAECDRLRNRLKNCENKKFEDEVYYLRHKLKNINDNKNYKKQLQKEQEKTKRLTLIIQDLKTKLLTIDKHYQNIIAEIERSFKLDTKKVEFLNDSLIEIHDFLKNRLALIFNLEYKNILSFKDEFNISMKTLLLDLTNIFLAFKLFDMHLFDCVIDRIKRDVVTDKEINILITNCNTFSKELYDKVKNEKRLNFQNYSCLLKKFIKENK